jgi:hypothetical protein
MLLTASTEIYVEEIQPIMNILAVCRAWAAQTAAQTLGRQPRNQQAMNASDLGWTNDSGWQSPMTPVGKARASCNLHEAWPHRRRLTLGYDLEFIRLGRKMQKVFLG